MLKYDILQHSVLILYMCWVCGGVLLFGVTWEVSPGGLGLWTSGHMEYVSGLGDRDVGVFVSLSSPTFTTFKAAGNLESLWKWEGSGVPGENLLYTVSNNVCVLRYELHTGVRRPLSPGFLLPVQLGDALPAESLGVALPKPVGDDAVGGRFLPAVQEKVLPQNMNDNRLGFLRSSLFFFKKTKTKASCVR